MNEPDSILPDQLESSSNRLSKLEGEVGLLWAIFNDGIQTYCREILKGRTSSLDYREVERWIFRPDSDAVTSFSSLCELFELEPKQMRRALLRFRDEPSEKLKNLLIDFAA